MFPNKMIVIPIVTQKLQFKLAIADPIISVLIFEFQQHCCHSNFAVCILHTIQSKLTIIERRTIVSVKY